MRMAIIALLMLAPVAAFAQQPASPMEQAVTGKLQEEFNQNLQLRSALIQSQSQVADLKKQIEDAAKASADKK